MVDVRKCERKQWKDLTRKNSTEAKTKLIVGRKILTKESKSNCGSSSLISFSLNWLKFGHFFIVSHTLCLPIFTSEGRQKVMTKWWKRMMKKEPNFFPWGANTYSKERRIFFFIISSAHRVVFMAWHFEYAARPFNSFQHKILVYFAPFTQLIIRKEKFKFSRVETKLSEPLFATFVGLDSGFNSIKRAKICFNATEFNFSYSNLNSFSFLLRYVSGKQNSIYFERRISFSRFVLLIFILTKKTQNSASHPFLSALLCVGSINKKIELIEFRWNVDVDTDDKLLDETPSKIN